MTSPLTSLRLGDRVALRHDVSVFGLGTFPAGTLGTVDHAVDDALDYVIEICEARTSLEALRAAATFRAIRAQGGCEHFDPAVTDGRLVSLMEVIING